MWKNKIISFAERFQHPAWGLSHCKRVYELCTELANDDPIVDMDSIFASAYLHDIGAFEPYKKPELDHADVSFIEVVRVLIGVGFPSEKIPAVQDIIKGHMFYSEPNSNIESIIFHDADTLEFMGIIGVTRLLSIVGLDDWTPDLKTAIDLIEKYSEDLINRLYTEKARALGQIRKEEMELYLELLSKETYEMKLL